MVAFEAVMVVSLVTSSLLGRTVEAEVCGLVIDCLVVFGNILAEVCGLVVDCLVVFGDILAGLVTTLVTVLFNNGASVVDPAALCTV